MSELDLGIFTEFWNGYPNHMPFRSLNESQNAPKEWNLTKSLERLDLICDNHTEEAVIDGIYKLLKEKNWRTHLVALLASFKITKNKQQEFIPYFWREIEEWSTVGPKILSVLTIIDKDFESKGKEIIENGFRINYSERNLSKEEIIISENGVIAMIEALIMNQNDKFPWREKLLKLIDSGRLKSKHS